MKRDYRSYPPQIAADMEVTEDRDGDRASYIVGSGTVGRYILLRATEYKVLQLIGDSRTPAEVCDEFKRRYDATLSVATLKKFLAKLDEVGLLAGERAQLVLTSSGQSNQRFYLRFKLFNPDRLFARLVPLLRWVWTPGFVVFTLALMVLALLLSLLSWAEVTSYGAYVLREHFLAVFVAGTLVVFSHEFAHGLTCKAFGGRTTEVGLMMIYYFFPALYCNVSGIHLIPQRNRRLWVIAAGVYWQLLVGIVALLAWFIFDPYTFAADLAFIFFIGSVVDIIARAPCLAKTRHARWGNSFPGVRRFVAWLKPAACSFAFKCPKERLAMRELDNQSD